MKKTIKATAFLLSALFLVTACSENNNENDSIADGGIKTINTPDDFQGNAADINDDLSEVELKSGDTYAVITIKGFGEITCKLYPDAAPEGVQNFIDLANSGYYTDKVIHRVMKDFMLQGGSANGDGLSAEGENSFGVEYNKKMRHYYGALCYANAGGINGTQFYIVNNKSFNDVTADTFTTQLSQIDNLITEVNEYINQATGDEEAAYYKQYLDYYTSMQNTLNANQRALEERTDEINEKYSAVGGVPYLDGGYTVFGQTVKGFDVIDAISEVEVEASSNGEMSHPVQEIVISSVEIKTA